MITDDKVKDLMGAVRLESRGFRPQQGRLLLDEGVQEFNALTQSYTALEARLVASEPLYREVGEVATRAARHAWRMAVIMQSLGVSPEAFLGLVFSHEAQGLPVDADLLARAGLYATGVAPDRALAGWTDWGNIGTTPDDID